MRLEAAARKLLSRRADSALAIALEVGISSAASFSRAFHGHFGMTPGAGGIEALIGRRWKGPRLRPVVCGAKPVTRTSRSPGHRA